MHQGVPRIESGAYTLVREHFNWRDNAVPPQAGALDGVFKLLLIDRRNDLKGQE
jgi:hypothetical protein